MMIFNKFLFRSVLKTGEEEKEELSTPEHCFVLHTYIILYRCVTQFLYDFNKLFNEKIKVAEKFSLIWLEKAE